MSGEDVDVALKQGYRKIEDIQGGVAKYEEAASGDRNYQGVIKLPKPGFEGQSDFFPFEFGYETFQIGQPIISATKMNVLYMGVDNPLEISIPGYTSDKISVNSPSEVPISLVSGKSYTSKPKRPGIYKIRVASRDGKSLSLIHT